MNSAIENNRRLEIASRILAGFASNPAVFAHNPNCGWSLVNCTDEQLVGVALDLTDILIKNNKINPKKQENPVLEAMSSAVASPVETPPPGGLDGAIRAIIEANGG